MLEQEFKASLDYLENSIVIWTNTLLIKYSTRKHLKATCRISQYQEYIQGLADVNWSEWSQSLWACCLQHSFLSDDARTKAAMGDRDANKKLHESKFMNLSHYGPGLVHIKTNTLETELETNSGEIVWKFRSSQNM